MKHKIAIYSFFFGAWPDWIEVYFESLKNNPTIDFYILTDCDTTLVEADNIIFKKIVFEEYLAECGEKLGLNLSAETPVKLCDLRPALGFIHQDLFADYQFYGWTDLDLLFGDIRSFYTDELLDKYDVLSTHEPRIAGHLSLFKNNDRNRTMFHNIYRWEEKFQNPKFVGVDETCFTNAYTMTIPDKFNEKFNTNFDNGFFRFLKKQRKKKMYMKEQYTTPFLPVPWIDGSLNSDQPDEWYYKNGHVTNNRDGDRKFIYIHFMNFKSSYWRHDGT